MRGTKTIHTFCGSSSFTVPDRTACQGTEAVCEYGARCLVPGRAKNMGSWSFVEPLIETVLLGVPKAPERAVYAGGLLLHPPQLVLPHVTLNNKRRSLMRRSHVNNSYNTEQAKWLKKSGFRPLVNR